MQYQTDLFNSVLDNDTHITIRLSSSASNVLCSHNQAPLHISISFACMYTVTLLESYIWDADCYHMNSYLVFNICWDVENLG